MKKIVDDWRLIYKVCSLYYEDDMRQQEISDYLGIFRATISRMLQKEKESGIVRVEVVNPIQFTYGKLEKTLERKYGLKDVIVVENSSLDTRQESLNKMYEKAALYLSQFFRDGDYIGVSMGFTLHNVARTRRSFAKDNQYMFVPIVGGISPNSINGVDVQSNQIAREFADKNIRVNAICPGYVRTPLVEGMAKQSDPENPERAIQAIADAVPLKRLADPEEVGELAAFLGCYESSYITGTQIVIDGGSTLPETTSMGQ